MVSIEQKLLRGGAVAARRAHNPKVVGSVSYTHLTLPTIYSV